MNALTKTEVAAAAEAVATAEPRRDRRRFIGGSDVAAVMGLSPWETPVELWQEKTGKKPESTEVDLERERRFRRGHKLEPFIRDMVIEKLQDMGVRVELLAINERYQDPEFPFLACEIDFELRLWGDVQVGERIYTLDGVDVNADAKSVSGFARKKWGSDSNTDVPIEYACQFMHGMSVRSRCDVNERGLQVGRSDRRLCLVAALRSFDDVDIYWTERDDEVADAMRARCVEFWTQHVLTGVPPDPLRFSDIKILFPRDNGMRKEATPEIAAKIMELALLRARRTADEAAEEELCFEIGQFIEPHSEVLYEGKVIATWKGQPDTRLDQKSLKAELPDVFEQYAKCKTIRVLRIPKNPKPPKN